MQRKCVSIFLFTLLILPVLAQAPAGYYSAAKGSKGSGLKTSLYGIISEHTARSYDQLWTDFKSTDVRPDGKIWDMYSDLTNYTPGIDQGASAGSENSGGYNREHSFPKSWFGGKVSPMFTDLFHLVPTDVYCNSRRSNLPFGETNGETWKSHNSFSKVGDCTVPGFNGSVFEPNDEYKGDFARIYFYMATAYEGRIASWKSNTTQSGQILSGDSYTAYAPWALKMLLRWAADDPVSEKEINRNNAVYKIQKNRNPYVDFPGLEQYVWGSKTTEAFDPDNYEGGGEIDPGPDPAKVAAPVFSPASGVVAEGTVVTFSTSTEGASIYYSVNGGDLQSAYMTASVEINERTVISAYAQLGTDVSETVEASYQLPSTAPIGESDYVLVTDASELVAGYHYLIGAKFKDEYVAMSSGNNSNVRTYTTVTRTENDTRITTDTNADGLPYTVLLGGTTDAWTLFDEASSTYLALTANENKLYSVTTHEGDETLWTINVSSDGISTITSNAYSSRSIKFNPGAPRFATYTSGQTSVSLYVSMVEQGINLLETDKNGCVDVYNAKGILLRNDVEAETATKGLPAGCYIIGNRQVLVR